MELDLAVVNLKQVVSPLCEGPLRGEAMGSLKVIRGCSIGIKSGKIVQLKNGPIQAKSYIDGKGLIALPGFIDSHTHIPFLGNRSEEFLLRLEGKSYMEIMKGGGGIRSTVREVRKASPMSLTVQAAKFLDAMLQLGVTTVEGKSGYGLERESELKQLRVLKALNSIHPVDVVSTFLGAHALPEGVESPETFLASMIDILDEVSVYTDTVDIFCERGVFDVSQSREYLIKAKEKGFKLRVHADELAPSGGGKLAVELGALSADHLIRADDETLALLASSSTIATLLPGTSFFLREDYARGRELIDKGAIVAIASDFNPGSCNIYDPFFVMFLAVTECGLSVEEAIVAYTANAAASLGFEGAKGIIEEGYDADLVLLKLEDYSELVYNFSHELVEKVIKGGIQVK